MSPLYFLKAATPLSTVVYSSVNGKELKGCFKIADDDARFSEPFVKQEFKLYSVKKCLSFVQKIMDFLKVFYAA